MDANKDGYISREEAKKLDAVFRHIDELDLNRDGKLSQAELDTGSSPAAGGPSTGTIGGGLNKR